MIIMLDCQPRITPMPHLWECQLQAWTNKAGHANLLCRDCYYELRQVVMVSRNLTQAAASTVVHAFVVPRL